MTTRSSFIPAQASSLAQCITDSIQKVLFERLNESRQMLLLDRTMMNIVQPNKSIMSQTIVEETETKEEINQDETTMNFTNFIENEMAFNETTLNETASNLNETVRQARKRNIQEKYAN